MRHSVEQSMLSQVQAFLQHKAQHFKSGVPSSLFQIVVLGCHPAFGSSLNTMIHRLQEDVILLHPDAKINFLDAGNVSEMSMATAVRALTLRKVAGRVISLTDTMSLSLSEGGSDNGAAPFSREMHTAIYQSPRIPASLSTRPPKVKVGLSFDFDALSALLGTGQHPENNMNYYSSAIFAGRTGGRRLLRMLQKYRLADRVTWFIPGHTMETFPDTVKEIVATGAEIGLHGYAHEGAYQMTPSQERDVLVKCMKVAQGLTGKTVRGYRAPMYQLRETTIALLKEKRFLYDSSLSHHDSQLYFTPDDPPVQPIDFSQPAGSWLRPAELTPMNSVRSLVEIPTGWYNEDMMSMQYFPHAHNSHGFVDPEVIERMWKQRFLWLWENGDVDSEDGSFVFPLLMHPDTSAMPHVLAMVDRFMGWLRGWDDSVRFYTHEELAQQWLEEQKGNP